MNVNKICRCCLTNDAPLLTIYDGGTTNKDCLAGMINKVTGIKPEPNDKMPDKACLACIMDVKHFYEFKIKCENSHGTLQQLLLLSKPKAQLYSSIKNTNQYQDATTDDKDTTTNPFAKHQLTSMDSEANKDNGQSVNYETNIESAIPKCYVYKSVVSLVEDTISLPSSPIDLPNSTQNVETITDLEDSTQKQHQPSPETTENIYTREFIDLDEDSCDSIEFISETPQVNECINVLDELDAIHNKINNGGFNDDTAVEYTFINLSQSQYVPKEVNNISLDVDEDIIVDNVQPPSNKSIDDLIHYPNHVDIRAGSRYHCVICEQGFYSKNDFINHLETHEKPYPCVVCKNWFNDYYILQQHLMEHTRDTIHSQRPSNMLAIASDLSTADNPYKCKFCNRTFTEEMTCSNHEKMHNVHRPYKCQYCDETFVLNSSRRSHEIFHTGSPYICKFCSRGFINRKAKVKHEAAHNIIT